MEMSNTSTGELLLRKILKHNIDNENVLYNYRGTGAINDKTKQPLELDAYYPDYKLAFEFQGEQHYKATQFADGKAVQEIKYRDAIKEKYCNENGILLIKINALQLSALLSQRSRIRREIPNINLKPMITSRRGSEEEMKFARILEWECKKYRKYLNDTYSEHISSKTDVKVWRDNLRAQGIKIPKDLQRVTKIPPKYIKDATEKGKYEITKEIEAHTLEYFINAYHNGKMPAYRYFNQDRRYDCFNTLFKYGILDKDKDFITGMIDYFFKNVKETEEWILHLEHFTVMHLSKSI